jgi:hypothetical protein
MTITKTTLLGSAALSLTLPIGATGGTVAFAGPTSHVASSPPGATEEVVDWNVIALRSTAAAPFNPPLESRDIALVQAAVFDAVNSITRHYRTYAIHVRAHPNALAVAATASAAHATLTALLPAQQATLDSAYQKSLAAVPAGKAKQGGIAAGQEAAAGMLSLRASDHSGDVVPYTPGSGPGVWIPTPPAFLPALDPGWGRVTPYLLRSGSQFRPGPPPALTSRAYTRDFHEIVSVGSATSATRTPGQTTTARFWTSTAPQMWNQAVQQLVMTKGFSADRAARAFVLLGMAGADALIASWDTKYAYNQWRPITAIRAADTNGSPGTRADPTWTPLVPTPPFPDYISGHSTFAGAAETVLGTIFGLEPGTFSPVSPATPGVVRTYHSFQAVANEVVNARVWGGIHWRTSCVVGLHVGKQVGRYDLAHGPARR